MKSFTGGGSGGSPARGATVVAFRRVTERPFGWANSSTRPETETAWPGESEGAPEKRTKSPSDVAGSSSGRDDSSQKPGLRVSRSIAVTMPGTPKTQLPSSGERWPAPWIRATVIGPLSTAKTRKVVASWAGLKLSSLTRTSVPRPSGSGGPKAIPSKFSRGIPVSVRSRRSVFFAGTKDAALEASRERRRRSPLRARPRRCARRSRLPRRTAARGRGAGSRRAGEGPTGR